MAESLENVKIQAKDDQVFEARFPAHLEAHENPRPQLMSNQIIMHAIKKLATTPNSFNYCVEKTFPTLHLEGIRRRPDLGSIEK